MIQPLEKTGFPVACEATKTSTWSLWSLFSYTKPDESSSLAKRKINLKGTDSAAFIFRKKHPHHESSLNLSYAQKVPTDLGKYTRGIKEINLAHTALPSEYYNAFLPALKVNNREVRALDLTFAQIDLDAVKALLDAFPNLSHLNLTITSGLKVPYSTDQFNAVLFPWIKNNPHLKSIAGVYIGGLKDFEDFIEALPATLESIDFGLEPNQIDPSVMQVGFKKFAEKVQASLTSLSLSGESGGGKSLITLKDYELIPTQLPNLTNLSVDTPMDGSSDIIKKVLSQLVLKGLNLYPYYFIEANDVIDLINANPGLEEFSLPLSPDKIDNNQLEKISVALSNCDNLKSISYPYMPTNPLVGLNPVLIPLKKVIGELHNFYYYWTTCSEEDFTFVTDNINPRLTNLNFAFINQQSSVSPDVIRRAVQNFAVKCPLMNDFFTNTTAFNGYEAELKKAFSTFHSLRNIGFMFDKSSKQNVDLLITLIANNPNLEYIQTNISKSELEALKKACPQIGQSLFVFSYFI